MKSGIATSNGQYIDQVRAKDAKSISVRYIYSACVVTTTPDVSILHDPWFTQGAFDGSWYHYPEVLNPLAKIGDVDYLFVSHVHPDHYDPVFIKTYLSKYGTKKVLVANHASNHLARKMRIDEIQATIVLEPMKIGDTEITIVPHITGSSSDIDSAIVIKYRSSTNKTHCVVNVNDIVFNERMIKELKNVAGDVDILMCGFTGAGPYPQTYFDGSDPRLIIEAEKNKAMFLERYKTLTKKINAKVNIPFAGKYLLGGKLAELNQMRAVADAVEVLDIDSKAIVLSDDGGEINTFDLTPSSIRTTKYDEQQVRLRISEIKNEKLDYERLLAINEVKQLPLKRLLFTALKNAIAKSECTEDYFFCIAMPGNQYAIINANKGFDGGIHFVDEGSDLPTPRSEILIDPRLLFGLLTHVYHWNSAEVGSQYNVRRTPDVRNQDAQKFLYFLTC